MVSFLRRTEPIMQVLRTNVLFVMTTNNILKNQYFFCNGCLLHECQQCFIVNILGYPRSILNSIRISPSREIISDLN